MGSPNSSQMVDRCLDLTIDSLPSLRFLLEAQDAAETSFLRVTSMKPEIPRWKTGRVTLLGDAAHNMTPTGSSGANTALRDAARLAQCLTEETPWFGQYEEEMGKYAAELIVMSAQGGTHMFNQRPMDEWIPIEGT